MSAADRLDAANKAIIAAFVKGMAEACLIAEKDAKKRCPVDEGLLRASIKHTVNVDAQRIVGKIGSNLEYAPYVHQGTGIYAVDGKGRKQPWVWYGDSKKWRGRHITSGQRPVPFLKDAVEQNKAEILAALISMQLGVKIK